MRKIVRNLVICVVTLNFVSCETIDNIGPDICPSADFELKDNDLKLYRVQKEVETEINNGASIDFATDGLRIKIDFSESVKWRLTIYNASQEKFIEGEGESVDYYWYGQPSKLEGNKMFFNSGDVTVKLEVDCQEEVTKKISLSGEQKFSSLSKKFGLLIRDWDQNGSYPVDGETFSAADGWKGGGSGANPWVFDYFNATPSPAGGKYFEFYAKTPDPAWYLGGTSFPTAGIADSLPTTNLDSLYLNIFVRSDSELPNAGSQVALQSGGTNYLSLEDITWNGWKLLSYKLSDFKTSTGVVLPNTSIDNFVLQLGATPLQSTELRVQYDLALITVGSPLFTE